MYLTFNDYNIIVKWKYCGNNNGSSEYGGWVIH